MSMGSLASRIRDLVREIKRRKVFAITVVYVVLAAGALELLDILIPATRLPEWATPLLVSLAVVGLPIVIVLSWTFDITPEGVVRTGEAEGGAGKPGQDEEPDPAPAADREADEDARDEVAPDITAVAVLPFDNLSGSDEAQPFAMGLHDDLLTELSRVSALTVISRTSVQGYRGTDKSVRQIARELGVGTVVEGAVQMAGNRIRLNIQVIDARTDVHRWAERYDRELTTETIFDLQSELATRIMSAVEAELTSAERVRVHERPTDDLEAYRLYALGRDSFVDRSKEGMTAAAGYFQEAIQHDPAYALAWAGLGMALVGLVDYGHVDDEEFLERGTSACRKAVELNPELAEGHAAVGALRAYLRDGPGARAALGRAMEYGPGLALGYQWASWVDLLVGRPEAALESAERATKLAPLEPEARGNLAMACLGTGDPDRAASEARRSLESHPQFAYSRWVLALALCHLGRRVEAIQEFISLDDGALNPWPTFLPWARMGRGLDRLAAGDEEGAKTVLFELSRMEAPFEEGLLLQALGETDAAFEAFGRAAPYFWDDALALRYFESEPLGRPLRSDSRFRELVADLDRSWGI
jgi:TolB-like protein/Flp pilus assembly protein TadD